MVFRLLYLHDTYIHSAFCRQMTNYMTIFDFVLHRAFRGGHSDKGTRVPLSL